MRTGAVPPLPDAGRQDAMRRVRALYDDAHEQLTRALRERLLSHPALALAG